MSALNARFPNGATCADYLGTSASAATKAAALMSAVRERVSYYGYNVPSDADPRTVLAIAEGSLLDALSELREVAAMFDRVAAR